MDDGKKSKIKFLAKFDSTLTKTLTGNGQKVDFLVQIPIQGKFWIISKIMKFPLKTTVHGLKSELKWMRYKEKTIILIKCVIIFKSKRAVLGHFCTKNNINLATI